MPEGNELMDIRQACAMWRRRVLDVPSALDGNGRQARKEQTRGPIQGTMEKQDGVARLRLSAGGTHGEILSETGRRRQGELSQRAS